MAMLPHQTSPHVDIHNIFRTAVQALGSQSAKRPCNLQRAAFCVFGWERLRAPLCCQCSRVVLISVAAMPMTTMVSTTATVATLLKIVRVFVAHKVDWLIAGVIAIAMSTPVFGMARGHMQVDRLLLHNDRGLHYHSRLRNDHGLRDDDRLWINHWRWWLRANHHAAIHTGPYNPINADAHIGLCLRGPCGTKQCDGKAKLGKKTVKAHEILHIVVLAT
jgi:hypothetical protein